MTAVPKSTRTSSAERVVATPQRRLKVLDTMLDVVSLDRAAQLTLAWARERHSRVVCLCNVHAAVTAGDDPLLRAALDHADLVAPDGSPVAWMMRRQGAQGQRRVAGTDLMVHTLDLLQAQAQAHAQALAQTQGQGAAQRPDPPVSVYLHGSTPQTLEALQQALQQRWPLVRIAGAWSPPFHPPTADERQADARRINASGAGVVWVGLGCPRQEAWMHAQQGQVQAVMVGVGAAFDFLSGNLQRAPLWMRRCGLEWLHRLLQEPRRLAGRYFGTNLRFMAAALRQLLRGR